MIVAVSFGLLVPPRILNACRFGGLNVHPSMLPDLKGSAPVEHAILNGYTSTGVTVQTLHPSKFDEGKIVLQTPQPGITIPDSDRITAPELKSILAPIGAEMLVQTIRDGLYEQPQGYFDSPESVKVAPKLSPESRHINFMSMEASHILRLNRAIGRLWVNVKGLGGDARDLRLTFGSGMRLADSRDLGNSGQDLARELETGLLFASVKASENITDSAAPLLVKTVDESILCIPQMTIAGMKPGHSASQAARAGLLSEPSVHRDRKIYQFKLFPS
ncbi:Methionyl-tRNA formyltransferase [Neophaeococcomyces mojaviensis]|uniref:Methionyl-tRNA formyltransferase n=1 Tax=Neophaeococcomyces mojaviensis TaxID=3383035 RepID=A0ACC3ADJ2_9EURO|nr:Methionyl-tRNA formyltransferase [Knufia sp. JES_112]